MLLVPAAATPAPSKTRTEREMLTKHTPRIYYHQAASGYRALRRTTCLGGNFKVLPTIIDYLLINDTANNTLRHQFRHLQQLKDQLQTHT